MVSNQDILLYRLAFHRRIQLPHESVEKFAFELSILIKNCQYSVNEERFILRERFLAGLNSKFIADEIVKSCQKPLELTVEHCLELVKNFNGVKEEEEEEEFNEVFNDVEACLKVDLKFDYEIMSSISYSCKTAILLELLNNKETVKNPNHPKYDQVWQKVFRVALKNEVLFESVEHFKAIFERWKMDALEAKRLGINRPQSADNLIWNLYDLQNDEDELEISSNVHRGHNFG